MTEKSNRVVVGLSGGVDSATAALLLKERGHDVIGLHLRLPAFGDEESHRSEEDARAVAEHLNVRLRIEGAQALFEGEVLSHFIESYASGRTPNPCVRCNPGVKFRRLLDVADEENADAVATGHYVRAAMTDGGRHALRESRANEDQSYFLAGLHQEQLGRAVFPLSEMTKDEVRRRAHDAGIPVHNRPDSQDLCFLASGHYRDFLAGRAPEAFRPGPIVHVSGEVLGRHNGIASYTIGQRRGLGIAHSEPLYVVLLSSADNAVIVGEERYLLRTRLTVGQINWMAVPRPAEPLCARVRIRYNHPGSEARIVPLTGGWVRVEFAEPERAPAPGQAAVFYRDGLVLGGGTIEEVLET